MKKHFYRSVLAIIISTQPALACYPDPEFSYDEVSSQDISIATATVMDVELETSETSSCWRIRYSGAQYLYGLGAKEFSVTTCTDEVFQIDVLSEEDEGLEYLGFVQNAEVLLGVVGLGEGASDLRYAIPSCWGPLHINLGMMSTKERAEFLEDFERQVESIR